MGCSRGGLSDALVRPAAIAAAADADGGRPCWLIVAPLASLRLPSTNHPSFLSQASMEYETESYLGATYATGQVRLCLAAVDVHRGKGARARGRLQLTLVVPCSSARLPCRACSPPPWSSLSATSSLGRRSSDPRPLSSVSNLVVLLCLAWLRELNGRRLFALLASRASDDCRGPSSYPRLSSPSSARRSPSALSISVSLFSLLLRSLGCGGADRMRRPADWPILLIAVVSHLTSILVSYVVFHRLFSLPGWIVNAMSFNSFVFLLLWSQKLMLPRLTTHSSATASASRRSPSWSLPRSGSCPRCSSILR
jgi:hypothetical protein